MVNTMNLSDNQMLAIAAVMLIALIAFQADTIYLKKHPRHDPSIDDNYAAAVAAGDWWNYAGTWSA